MPKTITIEGPPGKPGQVYYNLKLNDVEKPTPQSNELLIKLSASALNHRDLFIRRHLYPSPSFTTPLCADGCGTVTAIGTNTSSSWQGKRVIINPGTGWKDSPAGPEAMDGYKILGGTKTNEKGTLAEFITVDESEVEEAPAHLSDGEAAAMVLTGLTAWRAVKSKADVKEGQNVLIIGIGGGVALMALAFCVAMGASVYVTSGSEEKIGKAKELGAKDGVNYKDKDWEKQLLKMAGGVFDAVIDGAGGDVVEKGTKILKVLISTLFPSRCDPNHSAARRRNSFLRHDPRSQNSLPHANRL
jgi:NADPH:quinone reductase-like Zn-dependent oxidoreductase